MTKSDRQQEWTRGLRCPACVCTLREITGALHCENCDETYPILDRIPRMLAERMRTALSKGTSEIEKEEASVATALSFGYEWNHFHEMRPEWEKNFQAYFLPLGPAEFHGARVLDAGCGTGRHAFYAAAHGAEVFAVDLGSAVEVARRNNPSDENVHVIQADLQRLPFEPKTFDLIYSIGVLHHLSEPEVAFRNLLRYLKPGGRIHIYLYWKPEGQPFKQIMLSAVSALRKLTTKIPHGLLHAFSYPAAAIAFAGFVWPYQLLSAAGFSRIAERMPMKQYAQYPFRVCVNDQFDRFSAPIEYRYARAEVLEWFDRAGLQEVTIRPNFGWCATGRKPEGSQ